MSNSEPKTEPYQGQPLVGLPVDFAALTPALSLLKLTLGFPDSTRMSMKLGCLLLMCSLHGHFLSAIPDDRHSSRQEEHKVK